MIPVKNTATRSGSSCSIPSLFISLSILCILPLCLFFFGSSTTPPSLNPQINLQTSLNSVRVYVANLPRSLNYGLLENYWALDSDSRIGSEVDNQIRKTHIGRSSKNLLPYPENPIIKQYSAEYWILGDLMTPEKLKLGSFAKRVFTAEEADVIFVPFFATLSAEMQLIVNKGVFRKKEGNEDYERQRMVVDLLKQTEAWKRSGGRNHVFVITGTWYLCIHPYMSLPSKLFSCCSCQSIFFHDILVLCYVFKSKQEN